jgi:hypothetical protein
MINDSSAQNLFQNSILTDTLYQLMQMRQHNRPVWRTRNETICFDVEQMGLGDESGVKGGVVKIKER